LIQVPVDFDPFGMKVVCIAWTKICACDIAHAA
jgi:hypothetical protein